MCPSSASNLPSDRSGFAARLPGNLGGSTLKVLFCTPVYAPFIGGASTFLEAMGSRLAASGHQVTVLTTTARCASDFWQPPPSQEPPAPAHEVRDGVAVERLSLYYPWPAPYRFGLLRRLGLWLQLSGMPEGLARPVQNTLARWMPPLHGLSEALERWASQVDLIHSDDSSWDGLLVAAARAARLHQKPLVVLPLMHLGSDWVRAHYQMAHQVALYRDAAAVLALSSLEADAYAQLGVPQERLHTLGMGIELDPAAAATAADAAEFRRQHALSGPVVAFLGANTYDKGASALATAVVRLNLVGLAVDLVCAGPQSAALAAFIQQQSLDVRMVAENRVHILGIVDELTKQRLLAACDLLALPSQVDTFGIVFLEAWAQGKPVIGARAGGIPDLVQDGETGLLVPFGDVDALVAAIRRLLEEPGLAARLGAAGRQQVLQRYTWDQTYADLLKVYDTVLSSQARGRVR
jgi:glycogen(starch) synthase